MLTNQNRWISPWRLAKPARYWMAAGIIVLTTVVRWFLLPVLGPEYPYAGFFVPVIAIAWIGGLGPALLGVGLGMISADFFFMVPQYRFSVPNTHDLLATVVFVFIGTAAGAMSEAYRRALDFAERAYRLSALQQAELQQIYDSAPIGHAFLDEHLRYIRVNDALAAFNDLPANQHPGRHITEILSPEVTAKLLPILNEVLTTGKPRTSLEFQGPRARSNDELRHVRASFYPVQLGELRGLHGVVEDISAEKKAEEELKRVETQLRHALKMEAVGRLAGGVAHDFNNLLMVITSYTELLLLQLKDEPAHAKKLRAIAGAAQRAACLTRDLLAFSRKQPMQVLVLELDPLVQNFEDLLRSALREDIDLLLDAHSKNARIKIDPSQLEQVLMNLAVNARDAMPSGGRLTIRTAIRKFEQDEVRSVFIISAGEYAEIAVSDSGCGISDEIQSKIFEPFFTTKEPGRGTGLGLAMVYGIVKQSGGYIEVQSAEDQGTTFRIWLPTTSAISSQPLVPATIPQKGNGTILLVEDESTLRQAICESLTALGYRVIEAADGIDALAIVERDGRAIDLLLTDAVMPNLGGRELIQRLRASHPQIKAVLMSGYANSTSPTVFDEETTEVVFLQKPFAQAELAKALQQALGSTLHV
jgi:PAS domain S-box-containing protein